MRETTGARVPRPALWYALLGGPAAWTAHLLASYPLVPGACERGDITHLLLVTAACLALAVGAVATAAWAFLRTRGGGREGGSGSADTGSSGRFMALSGLFLGSLFTFAILMEGLPRLLQDPCARGL